MHTVTTQWNPGLLPLRPHLHSCASRAAEARPHLTLCPPRSPPVAAGAAHRSIPLLPPATAPGGDPSRLAGKLFPSRLGRSRPNPCLNPTFIFASLYSFQSIRIVPAGFVRYSCIAPIRFISVWIPFVRARVRDRAHCSPRTLMLWECY